MVKEDPGNKDTEVGSTSARTLAGEIIPSSVPASACCDKAESPVSMQNVARKLIAQCGGNEESPVDMKVSVDDAAALHQERLLHKSSSEKKRKFAQEKLATKMKIHFKKKGNIPVRGDLVCLAVDPRDRAQANPTGIVCVVLQVTNGYGVRVATQWGVINKGMRGKDPRIIPKGQYQKLKEHATIPIALANIQNQVRNNVHDEEAMNKISITEAHKWATGVDVVNGRNKCGCKAGTEDKKCRGGVCGCVRNKRACNSLCACHASCCNKELIIPGLQELAEQQASANVKEEAEDDNAMEEEEEEEENDDETEEEEENNA
jgi:hypothetical protein